MTCPHCGTENQYGCTDSRDQRICRYRRYKCICGERFSTYEVQPHNISKLIGELKKRGVHIR